MEQEPAVVRQLGREVPVLLAVYGTLRRGCRNHHLLVGCEQVGTGWVAGRLHLVRTPLGRAYPYPALVVPGVGPVEEDHDVAAGRVVVEVYRVSDLDALVALDALEAFDPSDPAGSEYLRVAVPLHEGSGVQAGVQVYAYDGDPAELGDVLPDGDWYPYEARLG